LRDTGTAAVVDARFGEFEKRRHHNRVSAPAQLGRHVVQVVIGRGVPATVGDEQDGLSHGQFLLFDL
jgi:hypothetical protein